MDTQAEQPDATLTLTRATLDAISLQQITFPQAVQSGAIQVQGNGAKLMELVPTVVTPLTV
jgi:alkyl sulfatase BDS1-like metallo-beta-lactamase superfamily hydrolase